MNQKSSQLQSQNMGKNQTTSSPEKTQKTTLVRQQSFDELQSTKGQYRLAAKSVGNWLDNTSDDGY